MNNSFISHKAIIVATLNKKESEKSATNGRTFEILNYNRYVLSNFVSESQFHEELVMQFTKGGLTLFKFFAQN